MYRDMSMGANEIEEKRITIFICMVFKVAFQYFGFDAIETTVTNGTILSYEISIAIGNTPIQPAPGKIRIFHQK